MSPDGGTVLVTGAARRIGRAVAVRLARGGGAVAIHCRVRSADADRTAELVRAAGGTAACFPADLRVPGAPGALVRAVEEALGPVRVLVNNASVFRRTATVEDAAADLDEHWAVNARAPWLLAAAAAPGMRAAGGGCIVNLGDIHGERPLGGYGPYSVSKAALHMMTRVLARELAPAIRVNAVAPGAIVLPDDAGDRLGPALVRRIPAGRLGTEEEIAEAVAFLVEGPTYVTGEILHVDGGRRLRG